MSAVSKRSFAAASASPQNGEYIYIYIFRKFGRSSKPSLPTQAIRGQAADLGYFTEVEGNQFVVPGNDQSHSERLNCPISR